MACRTMSPQPLAARGASLPFQGKRVCTTSPPTQKRCSERHISSDSATSQRLAADDQGAMSSRTGTTAKVDARQVRGRTHHASKRSQNRRFSPLGASIKAVAFLCASPQAKSTTAYTRTRRSERERSVMCHREQPTQRRRRKLLFVLLFFYLDRSTHCFSLWLFAVCCVLDGEASLF